MLLYRLLSACLSVSILRPSSWLIVSLAIFLTNYIFGPYSYSIRNSAGVYYFALCMTGLYLALRITESRGRDLRVEHHVSNRGERIINVLAIVFVGSAFLNIYYLIAISGVDFSEGIGAARNSFARNEALGLAIARTWWDPLTEFLSYGGIALWVMVANLSKAKVRTVYLAMVAALMPAVIVLVQGARNAAAFAVATLLITILIRRVRGLAPLFGINGARILVVVAVLFATYLSIILFAWRAGAESATDYVLWDLQMGEMGATLRPAFESANLAVGGVLGPFYALSFYGSHSLAFFSELFDSMDYGAPWLGAFHFRTVGFMLRPFGVPFPSFLEIVQSQSYFGMYPTAVQGALLDFGIYGAPVMFVLLGTCIGLIHRRAFAGSFAALAMLPLCLVAIAIIPIYYLFWGGMDLVVFILVPTLFVMRKRVRSRRISLPPATDTRMSILRSGSKLERVPQTNSVSSK